MKTFFTSSSLAVLCAVVFATYLVKTGDELPRRSPESYPPMASTQGEPIEPPAPAEVLPVEEVIAPIEQPETDEVEVVETPVETPEPEIEEPVREKKIVFEAYGPPAPTLPFVLNINAAEEGVSLQGSIPRRDIKLAITEAISEALEEEEIQNHLKFSPDTRSGLWIGLLPAFVERYFRHTGGNHELTIVDGKLMLSGAVPSEEAKAAVLKWSRPLLKRGLKLEEAVDVDESLKGKVAAIPEKVTKSKPAKPDRDPKPDPVEVAANEETSVTAQSAVTQDDTGGATEEEQLVFLAPFDEQYGIHTVPDLREETVEPKTEAESGKEGEEQPANVEETRSAPLVDDGKPLIFLFDPGSGSIMPPDRPKIDFAIKRAEKGRCIVYITAYSDYRGSFEQNQKLALSRANRVKDLIFAEDFDHEVKAEVKTRGDTLSRKRPGKESDEQLQRARRVVVEVYHLR